MKIEARKNEDCIILEPESEYDQFLLGRISAHPALSMGSGYNVERSDERVHVPFLKITKDCFLKVLTDRTSMRR